MTILLWSLACYGLVRGMVSLVQKARRQRRPTPWKPAVTPAMQQKMARALTTLITSGGMRELPKAEKMSKGYGLQRQHFEALAVPPEEDFARANLIQRSH